MPMASQPTTVLALAPELHSAYLGHAQTPTSAAYVILLADVRELRRVKHDVGALPVAGGAKIRPVGRDRSSSGAALSRSKGA